MRNAVLIVAIVATPAIAQTTNCTTIGNQTRCQTESGPTAADTMIANMLRPMPMNRSSLEMAYQAEQSQARRAAAYAQVGDLIAKGDCVGANRLAQFYGKKDIIKDTAKACPIQ